MHCLLNSCALELRFTACAQKVEAHEVLLCDGARLSAGRVQPHRSFGSTPPGGVR